jgi:class 3 adenylate cyclase
LGDLERFLAALGLEHYAGVLAGNDVDLDILPSLSDADLKELGLSLGHRRRLLRALAGSAAPANAAEPGAAPRAEAERRQLTVLFCDLAGSTALTARLDVEEMHALLAAYQNACAGAIARFEGHVAKFLGDGVFA